MNTKKAITILCVVLLPMIFFIAYSCSSVEDLKIGSLKDIEFKGLNDNVVTFQITAPIENPNHFRLHIKGSDLSVSLENKEIGKVKQMDELVIQAHSFNDYTVQIKVEVKDISSLMGSAMQLFSGTTPDIKITGKLKVRSFLYQRTISITDYKLVR